MAICLIGGTVVLLEPLLGVLGYVVLAFLRPQEVFWGLGAERLSLLVSVSALGATLLHFARRPRLDFVPRLSNALLLVLWLSIWLSTQFGKFATPQPIWMDYYTKVFLIYFAVIAVVDTVRRLEVLAVTLALSLGYLCWWANEMYFFNGWHTVNGPGHPGDTFYDHNDFAMVLAMTIPFLWFMRRFAGKRIVEWFFLGIVPLAAHGVIVTYSRGGFLGMSAVLIFCAIRERTRWLGHLLIVGGITCFLMFTGDDYRNRLGTIVDFNEDTSAQSRFGAWEAGKAMVMDNPIFGVGLKSYLRAFSYYSSASEFVAHSSWVQLSAECGLPALASWAGLMVATVLCLTRTLRRASRLPPAERERVVALANAVGGSLLAYFICGLFLSAEDLEFFYFLVAMGLILDRVTEHSVREIEASGVAA
jgi:probable O-glycosylation ligase (exosortase A-associated)